ncbi:MAG: hypothetical protein LQ351_005200 [Letrouitia transgressa]|nr:MAG: hypothetical protein LQ351_005200 [Letrouitia transgressa]
MESVRSYTADEVVQMMKETPLFMSSLENTTDDDGENVQLEAIKALQYEGTRAEVALNFKEQGNEMVAEKRWKDAREFYTKGILALKQERQELPEDLVSEDEKEKAIEEACYVNRALCNLELRNYRSTLNDTSHVLTFFPRNIKAHYRSALALLALQRLPEAHDICTRGIALTSPPSPSLPSSSTTTTTTDPPPTSRQQAPFLVLLSHISAAQSDAQAKSIAHAARSARLLQEKRTLHAALLARGIKTCSTPKPPDLEDAAVHLSPDPVDPSSELRFPVLFLYPLHSQSDFAKSVSEKEVLGVLWEEEMLPLPWDERAEYRAKEVEMYAEKESSGKGMVKVGRRATVLGFLGDGKVEVVDGMVRVFMVPKARAREWVESMKARAGK